MTDGFDDGFDGTATRQAELGLRMTPAQRLRWLETKRRELQRLFGLARHVGHVIDVVVVAGARLRSPAGGESEAEREDYTSE